MTARTRYALLGVIVLLYTSYSVARFARIEEVRLFNDSARYLELAAESPASTSFWVANRPPTVPLLYKLAGRDPDRIARMQLAASILAWTCLALVVASRLAPPWVGIVGCATVLAFSTLPSLSVWQGTILSESFSFSLLAGLIAVWIVLLGRRTRTLAAVAVVLGVAYSLARDTNALAVAMVAAFVLVTTRDPGPGRGILAGVAVVYVCTFAATVYLSDLGGRWVPSLYNNVAQRILTAEDRTEEFRRAGMPVDEALRGRSGKYAWDDDAAFFEAPELAGFRSWAYARGRGTYASFLAKRPLYFLAAPLAATPSLLRFEPGFFAADGYPSGIRLGPIFSSGIVMTLVLLLCAGMTAWGLSRRELRRAPLFRVSAALLMLALPGIWFTWHASPMEIERHALHFVVPGRIGFVLMSLFFLSHRLARPRS